MQDIFDLYRSGIQELLNRLGKDHPHYLDALSFQQRMEEYMRQAESYGDRDESRAGRAEITHRLNSLALDALGMSFNELCGIGLTYADMHGAPLRLRSLMFQSQFELITERTTRDFVGREFLFGQVNQYLSGATPEFTSGYVVIEGEPGIGKTAFISRLVKLNGWLRHYVSDGIVSTKQFIESVCAQLIVRYNVAIDGPLYDPTNPTGPLVDLLSKATSRPSNRPVVILLDALDEASDVGVPPTVNRLYLPRYLPDGAYIVATTQPQSSEMQRLRVELRKNIPIRKDDPNNQADVRLYIETFVKNHAPTMNDRIADWGVDRERFITTVLNSSEGNFMYIVSLMRDILDERVTHNNFGKIEYLPQGLESYYVYHWQRMKALAGEDFDRQYKRVAGFVAVAKEPVSLENLMHLTHLSRGQVMEVLNRWKQFFYETEREGHRMYRLYHASFRTFLTTQMDLESIEEEIIVGLLDDLGL